MKRYEIYRNIRKCAMIWGLPVTSFAIMMIAVVGSLLGIIFSFRLVIIVLALILNTVLYIILTRLAANPRLFQFSRVFPRIITSKRSNLLSYEED